MKLELLKNCLTKVTKHDILELSDLLQVCTKHKSRCEAAVHAMNSLFQDEEAGVVLLGDASNTFYTINRAAAVHNIRVFCPALATFAINRRIHADVIVYISAHLHTAYGRKHVRYELTSAS